MQPGDRWRRETQLVGFSEGRITAELARRWNFPMQMVQALQCSAQPLVEQAFSRLGAVLHLACLLADTPLSGPAALDILPLEVIDSLKLDVTWMSETLPDKSNFLNVTLP
jgi:HD-like signal output (HDOD) protein